MTDAKRHAPRGPIKASEPIQSDNPIQKKHLAGNAPRCHATTRQGRTCTNPAIKGGAVCRMHGGSAPQVKEAALARLLKLQHPAINRIGELIDQKEFPTVAYQASRDVLDRTMGKPAESVAVAHSGGIAFTHEMPE